MPITNVGANDCLAGPGLLAQTLYVALHTGTPPTDANEVSGGGYVRKEILTAGWTITNNAGENTAAISYTDPTDTWGDVLAGSLYNAATGGDIVWWADLTTDQDEIVSGSTVSIAAGVVSITIPLS